MNKITTMAAFVMFAVIMGMSAFAPAMAAPPDDVPQDQCEALDNPSAEEGRASDTAKTTRDARACPEPAQEA